MATQARLEKDPGGEASPAEHPGGEASLAEDPGGEASPAEDTGGEASLAEDTGGEASPAEDPGGEPSTAEAWAMWVQREALCKMTLTPVPAVILGLMMHPAPNTELSVLPVSEDLLAGWWTTSDIRR